MEYKNAPDMLLGDDILYDIEPSLERASKGKRFVNYLIDLFAFLAFMFVLGAVSALISPNAAQFWEDLDANPILNRLVTAVLLALFMGLQETIFKGASLGKFVTGTRAVNEDGSPITAGTAFRRGLSRIVPFEVFSGFAERPWHDSWTNTIVIDTKKSTYPATTEVM